MDEIRYNWLMGTIRDLSRQQSLLFCDSVCDGAADRREKTAAEAPKMPEQVLKTVFGYDSFRPLQREVIQNVLDGRDTLAVMPTGGGKSLCYEIPALILKGITVVVSPLIALMQDQVSQLEALGVPAVFLNSSLDWGEYRMACDKVRQGKIKLLYVSPEGLNTERIQGLLHDGQVTVACITIDEAHCISEWGHDFRPDYMEIAAIREQFPRASCLALTATATKQVQADIVSQLNLEQPAVLVASFNRPNLYLEVRQKCNPLSQLADFLKAHKGESGIIYCLSRKQVDELTVLLQRNKISATNYHAGLSDEERAEHQQDFITDKILIMVATLAFGMGINKPDVRFVVHYDMPKSIEQYYQEIGRAGRDGLPSSALLLYSLADLYKIRHFFAEKEDPEKAEKLLQGMIRYAESRVCRRRQLLSYFGDSNSLVPSDCCCDICTRGPLESRDVTVPAQKFMSCILRTRERYGASYIVDVLLGSKNKRLLENGHDKLSTYGIGTELSREDWFELDNCLLDEGFLQKSEEYGVLHLTEHGLQMLKERKEILLPIEFKGKKHVRKAEVKKTALLPDTADPQAESIVSGLKEWRRKMADELDVPPYVVFGDKTLLDIASRKPQNTADLLSCYGIGEAKAERFGSAILRIVEESKR